MSLRHAVAFAALLCATVATSGVAQTSDAAWRDRSFVRDELRGADRRITRPSHALVAAPIPPPPDVLNPEPSQWWLGIEAGPNLNSHPGTFQPVCPQCSFSDGSGTSIMAGAQLEYAASPLVHFTGKLLYDSKNADYTALVPLKMSFVQDVNTREITEVAINYERAAHVMLSYMMLHLAAELHPLGGLYLFAGPAFGINTGAAYTITERIVDPGYVYPNTGNLTEITMEPETDIAKISQVSALRVDLRAGLGFNIPLGRGVMLAPEASYGLPLTTIASFEGWKAESIHLIAVLKFAL